MQWVEWRVTLVPSRLPTSALLKRGPGWNWSGYNETGAAITQQAVRKKEAYTYILKIMCWQIFKPFINLLKCNLRLIDPKNSFSNFLDFLYLVWLSRYKSTIEINFSYQWKKTSGCRAHDVHVWWSESDFPWWQNDRHTEWQPNYIVHAAHAQARWDQQYHINNNTIITTTTPYKHFAWQGWF